MSGAPTTSARRARRGDCAASRGQSPFERPCRLAAGRATMGASNGPDGRGRLRASAEFSDSRQAAEREAIRALATRFVVFSADAWRQRDAELLADRPRRPRRDLVLTRQRGRALRIEAPVV